MNISEIRKRSGLTQKAFAEEYRIPLQTLKQWESSPTSTSHRQCPDYLIYYLDKLTSMEAVQSREQAAVSVSWEAARHKKYRFPVIYATEMFEISRIHPLKQKVAIDVAKFVRESSEIEKAIVFGGATTIRCHSGSDLDVALKLKDGADTAAARDRISEGIQLITEWNADVIWLNDEEPGTQLYNNIEEGVLIK